MLGLKCRTFKLSDILPREEPRKIWNRVTRKDLKKRKVGKDPPKDRNIWISFIRNHQTQNKYDVDDKFLFIQRL